MTDPEEQGFQVKKGHLCLYFFGTHNFAFIKEDPSSVKPFYENLHMVKRTHAHTLLKPLSNAAVYWPFLTSRPSTAPRRHEGLGRVADQDVHQDQQELVATDSA